MSQRDNYLKEMGVGVIWKLRERPSATSAPEAEQADLAGTIDIPSMDEMPPCFDDMVGTEAVSTVAMPEVSGMDWKALEETIRQCRACGLCQGRTQAVPGVGDPHAEWLFIGEGPGYFEDQQGEPFVGASGKLLDNMLMAMGLQRGSNAYIANIVKCRATDASGKDRPPTVDEAQACQPYLERQIALIQPKIIVAVGRVAATTLLRTDPQTSLAVLRGKAHLYRTPDGKVIPLVATYHPAYLLRQLSEKRKAWEDLCLAMRSLPSQD
ncbi:MAG: uracil-DNA glycosylase [Oxalobacter sp.]|nr:MAG: uracil-DNA glycosylase [Oxalobacter sp.]